MKCFLLKLKILMAKAGRPKNTINKAKHSKLITQKKNKLISKKLAHQARIKAIIRKSKEDENTNS